MALYLTRSTVKMINKMQQEIDSLNLSSAMNIIRVQEGTREKISLHLHDSVGQYLTALKWEINHLMKIVTEGPIKEKLASVSEICDAIFKEIRSISSDLMPTLIRDFGCFTAIENYLKEQLNHYPLQIRYENSVLVRQEDLKHEFQLNLYRMVQEFMQNTVKHSQASSVYVSFDEHQGELIMTYEDDGIGMPMDMGLPKSLSYRTQLFNGKMQRIDIYKGLKFKVTFKLEEVKDERNRSIPA
jgi:signal transduction histidine kinase